MIRRFSSTSKAFVLKTKDNDLELTWHTSIDLRDFKYMAIVDFQITAWPSDGKKLCHLTSNLTESSYCNPDGHIFSWFKKPLIHNKGFKS